MSRRSGTKAVGRARRRGSSSLRFAASCVAAGWVAGVGVAASPALAAASRPVATAAVADWRAGFQSRLDALRRTTGLPGLTAAVLLPDGRLVEFASGWRDGPAGDPIRPRDRMLAASIGKTIVAATAISLAEDGVLRLDAPISDYVGDQPWFARLPNARSLTLRILLNHSSGIPNHADDPAFLKRWTSDPLHPPSHLDLVGLVLDKPPLFPAGQGFHYSDTNYLIAGLVMEAVAKRSFYQLATERILRPLRLTGTVPSQSTSIPGLAPGHLDAKTQSELGWPERLATADGRLTYDPAIEWTGGGFASTAADLARWMKAYTTGHALRRAYLDDLFTSVDAAPERKLRYGLGVGIVRGKAGKAYVHGGSIPGYLSVAGYLPDRGVALAVMANGTAEDSTYAWFDELAMLLPDAAEAAGGGHER